MMPVRGLGPTCSVHDCMRPVRELGNLCTRHFQALSPGQREALQWEDIYAREGGDTEELDSLEVVYRLPSYGEEAA